VRFRFPFGTVIALAAVVFVPAPAPSGVIAWIAIVLSPTLWVRTRLFGATEQGASPRAIAVCAGWSAALTAYFVVIANEWSIHPWHLAVLAAALTVLLGWLSVWVRARAARASSSDPALRGTLAIPLFAGLGGAVVTVVAYWVLFLIFGDYSNGGSSGKRRYPSEEVAPAPGATATAAGTGAI
jgi:hypothetical protein